MEKSKRRKSGVAGRPKIKIEKTLSDRVLELISLVGLIVMIVIPIVRYNKLPDHIPIHFGADGNANRIAAKISIWILPAIGLFMYILLTALTRSPEMYNYPVEITRTNAHRQYRLSQRMLRIIAVIVVLFLAVLTFQITQISMSGVTHLSAGYALFLVGSIVLTVVVYAFISMRLK
ncbi:MAG: DUF1648 domain-containing protein [Bacteroidetes bacterium]|nr:DUF1648 domain-containing protein [Bacteroidota bacterium]